MSKETKGNLLNFWKRLLSLVCAVALILSTMPVPALAADDEDDLEVTDEPTYQVTVLVKDQDNHVIKNASVALILDDDTKYDAKTDSDGKAEIQDVSPAEYKVTAEATGYEGAETTLTVSSQDEDIELTLDVQTFSISAVASSGGKIELKQKSVEYDGEVSFKVTAEEGYRIDSVTVNDVDVTNQLSQDSYTIENIKENQTIRAEFKKQTYKITTIVDKNGKLTQKGSEEAGEVFTVDHGDSFDYTVTANDGYRIESVLVDGTAVGKDFDNDSLLYEGTISEVKETHTIQVVFTAVIYEVKFELKNDTVSGEMKVAQGDDEIKNEDKLSCAFDTQMSFTVLTDEGYEAEVQVEDSDVKVKKAEINVTSDGKTKTVYHLTKISKDTKVTVELKTTEYTITGWNPLGQKEKWTYTVEDENVKLSDPEKQEGYSFVGWYQAENGKVDSDCERVLEVPVTEMKEIDVYAVWNISADEVESKLEGTSYTNDSNEIWYNSDVEVTLKTKADGVQWSYTKNTDTQSTVLDDNSLAIAAAIGTSVDTYLFSAKKTGTVNEVEYSYVTDKTVDITVRQDGQKPHITIQQDVYSWSNLLEDGETTIDSVGNHGVTNRKTGPEDEYSVVTEDYGSGVETIEYQYVNFRAVKELDETELIEYLAQHETEWIEINSTKLVIEPASQGEWVLIVRATDYTGNVAYVDSTGVLFDQTAPEVCVTLQCHNNSFQNSVIPANSVEDIYSDDTITATVTITDDMLVYSDKDQYERYSVKFGDEILTVKDADLQYKDRHYVWTGTFEIAKSIYENQDGKQLTVLAADESNNTPADSAPQYTSGKLYIDTIEPTISIVYRSLNSSEDDAESNSEESNMNVTSDTVYANGDVTVEVTISDAHLDVDSVLVQEVSDEDNPVEIAYTHSQIDGDVYQFTVSKNSVYQISAKDLAGIPVEAKTLELKFDKTHPVITVEYTYSVVDETGEDGQAAVQSLSDVVVTDPDKGIDEHENFNHEESAENYSYGNIVAHITVTDNALNDAGTFWDEDTDTLKKDIVMTMTAVDGTAKEKSASIELENSALNDAGTEWTGSFEIKQNVYENAGKFELQVSVKDAYTNETTHTSELLAIDTEAANISSATLKINNDNPVAKAINFLTFGIFFNKEAKLTIEYEDTNEDNVFDGSGVVAVNALVNDSSVDGSTNEAAVVNGTATLTIPKEQIEAVLDGGLTITTTDLVGNELEPTELEVKCEDAKNSYVMYETTSPTISDDHESEEVSYHDEASDSYWMLDGKSVTIDTADADSGLNQVTVTDNEDVVSTSRESDNAAAEAVEADEDANYSYGTLDDMTKGVNYTVGYDELDSDTANDFTVHAVDNSNNGNKASGEAEKISVADAGDAEDYTFTVYKDTSNPELDSIVLSGNGWNDTFNSLKFGSFFNKAVTVTAAVHDGEIVDEEEQASSGMASTILTYADEDSSMELESFAANTAGTTSTTATTKLALAENETVVESSLAVAQSDNVGNTSSNGVFNENGTANVTTNLQTNSLMIETVKPVIGTVTVTPRNNWNGDSDLANGNNWYSTTDIAYSVPVSDTDAGIRLVKVTLNGQKVTLPGTVWEYYQLDTKTTEQTIEFNLKDLVNSDNKAVVVEGKNVLTVQVTDNAGNTSEVYKDTIYIDLTAPEVIGYEFSLPNYQDSADEDGLANVVVETSYGYYFKEKVDVTVIVADNALSSGIYQIVYKAVDKDTGKEVVNGTTDVFDIVLGNSTGECPANTEGSTSVRYTFTIPANFKGQIYAYAIDHVGNYPTEIDDVGNTVPAYASPDKAVVETLEKHEATSSILFDKADTPYYTADNQELYAGNVKVTMNVEDLYSGIRTVEWSLKSPEDSGNNASGSLSIDNTGKISGDSGWSTDSQDENLVTKISKTITVQNNSNSIVLNVKFTDRSGNTSTEEIMFSIDKTKPVIDVKYDNNAPDAANKDYYNKDRTATITITERNFDEDDVDLKLTNNLGKTPALSNWTKHSAHSGYASDADTYTATITFHEDGDYTFDLGFTDIAGNKAEPFSDQFTVDETAPVMNVTFTKADGSSVNFDEYSSSAVTATISIEEHNFDAGRVTCTMTQDSGTYPVSLSWGSGGDSNTATVTLNGDAHYTFDLASSDMAGNDADPYTQFAFYVDETDPVITLSGIQKANSGRDEDGNKIDVYPVVTVDDKYFNDSGMTFELTRANGEAITSSGERSSYLNADGSTVSAENGSYVFSNLEADDLYTLTVTATDLSGRTQSMMMLDSSMGDSEADSVNAAGGVESYTFSVNRDGTVYVYSDDLKELISAENLYYQPEAVAEKNLSIDAYDVEPLVEGKTKLSISRDGSAIDTMQSKSDDTGHVNESGNYNQWYQYTFALDKRDFEQDGYYDIVISDKDYSGNTRTNGETPINFYVDGTAPVVDSIVGLEKAQVNQNELTVEYSITDAFALSKVDIIVDGETQTVNEFDSTTYSGRFVVGAGFRHTVSLVATDLAGNSLNTDDETFQPGFAFNRTVTVSTNPLVLWYSNTPLFIGSIVAVASIAVIVIGVIVYRRRKAAQPEEKE